MKSIKVLEVIRQGEIGGGESHLIDLVNGFDTSIEPIVMSFTKGQMIDALSSQGIKCYVIETTQPFNLLIQKKIIRIIRDEHIDIIHVHGSRAASNLLIAAALTSTPLIYTVHGWSFHQDQSYFIRELRVISEKLICKRCKKVICVSENNRQLGIEEFGLSNTIVIENGINLNKFNPNIPSSDIEYQLRTDKNDFLVAFIGRVTVQKSPIDFIDSIAIAHNRNNKIKGILIGEGDMLEYIKEYIQQKKYDKFIHLEKFRQDIPQILKSIDVFVLPSLWEGLSIALIEAMAMKKAIVVTPTDGTREVITDHYNGIIVPFNSPEKLADSYIEYYDDNKKRIMYGENAYNIVKRRFDSQRVSNKVIEIYKSTYHDNH